MVLARNNSVWRQFLTRLWGGCLVLLATSSLYAGVSEAQQQRLGAELTPYGAERAGNDHEIPAWQGGLQPQDWPKSYTHSGQHHPDPFADDEVLYTITAQNQHEYAGILTDGQRAMFAQYPETFSIAVYPTRRSHSAPQWVYDNIYRNARSAQLTNDGNGIEHAYGGIPFPIPFDDKGEPNALQMVWNHLARFRGVHVVREAAEVAVQQNGRYQLVDSVQDVAFNFYQPPTKDNTSAPDFNNVLFYYLSRTKSPARLAGNARLIYEPLNQAVDPRQMWAFSSGQRRVRRAPHFEFDQPIAEADGLRTADDTDMFNGSPERFDWFVIGKQEKLIPYNNYRLDDARLRYRTMLTPNHVLPSLTRHELHRVWIVEARLKPGQRHIYKRRRFYIDEDSWSIAMSDQYDLRDRLWRVSIAYLKNYYEVPTTWSALDVFHDLKAKRYHALFLDNEKPTTLQFSNEPVDLQYFSPHSLQRFRRP